MKIMNKVGKITLIEPTTGVEVNIEGMEYTYEGNLQETTTIIKDIKNVITELTSELCDKFIEVQKTTSKLSVDEVVSKHKMEREEAKADLLHQIELNKIRKEAAEHEKDN